MKCRWYSSHKELSDKMIDEEAISTRNERNKPTMDLRISLQRNKFSFPKTVETVKRYKDNAKQEAASVQGSDAPAAQPENAAASTSETADANSADDAAKTEPTRVDEKPVGALADAEKKKLDLAKKLILAPLTTYVPSHAFGWEFFPQKLPLPLFLEQRV